MQHRPLSPGHMSSRAASLGSMSLGSGTGYLKELQSEIAELKKSTASSVASLFANQSPAASQVIINTLKADKDRLQKRTDQCASPRST